MTEFTLYHAVLLLLSFMVGLFFGAKEMQTKCRLKIDILKEKLLRQQQQLDEHGEDYE